MTTPLAIGGQTRCDEAEALSQADILALFDRILPDWYLEGLKNPGPGYEVLQAYAAMMARVALAVARLECGSLITRAAGGAFATVSVSFSRQTATAGAVTVKKGTVVTTSKGGRDFVTTADAVFGALDLGPITTMAIAVAPGWEWNVPGSVTTKSGQVLPGDIDTIKLPIQDPPYGDATIVVSQATDATGGEAAMLDQLGQDRGIPRSSAAESDQNYQARIRSLPDVISPDAIIRQVNAFVRTYFPTFDAIGAFIETWDIRYQTCYFGPPVAEGGDPADQPGVIPTANGFDPDLFCYDDPRPALPFRNRYLGEDDHQGGFIVLVPILPAISDVGMAYDDTAIGPSDLETSIGRRAVSAYDVPDNLVASELQGGLDGFDLDVQSFYSTLYALLQKIKGGGISAVLELDGQ